MKYTVSNNNKKLILIGSKFFLFMLLLTPLYLFNIQILNFVGIISIIGVLSMSIFDAIFRYTRTKLNTIWIWFLMFTFYNTILLIRNPTSNAFYMFALQVVLLFFLTVMSTIKLDDQAIKGCFKWGKISLFVTLIPAVLVAIPGGRIAFGTFNYIFSPVLYKIMVPCSFFYIANKRRKFIKLVVLSFIYFRMVERTCFFVFIVIFISYQILKKVKKHKIKYKVVYIGYIIVLILIVYGFIYIEDTEIGYLLNTTFRKYTGGYFFSGRNTIWKVAIDYIKLKPIFGYGLDHRVFQLSGITKSAHNTYIHILLQGGITGIFIFLMFFYSIWKNYYDYLDNDIAITAAAYLIGFLTFMNFEVTMVGNTVVTAIYMWFVLGIGLMGYSRSNCNYRK